MPRRLVRQSAVCHFFPSVPGSLAVFLAFSFYPPFALGIKQVQKVFRTCYEITLRILHALCGHDILCHSESSSETMKLKVHKILPTYRLILKKIFVKRDLIKKWAKKRGVFWFLKVLGLRHASLPELMDILMVESSNTCQILLQISLRLQRLHLGTTIQDNR